MVPPHGVLYEDPDADRERRAFLDAVERTTGVRPRLAIVGPWAARTLKLRGLLARTPEAPGL